MKPSLTLSKADRLVRLKAHGGYTAYYERLPLPNTTATFSIYGEHLTGEIFVEVNDGGAVWVDSFPSRLRRLSPTRRAAEVPWFDIADAFELARTLWRERPDEKPSERPGAKLTRTEIGWIVEYAIVTLHGRREVILRPLETSCRQTAEQRCTALLAALGLDRNFAHAR